MGTQGQRGVCLLTPALTGSENSIGSDTESPVAEVPLVLARGSGPMSWVNNKAGSTHLAVERPRDAETFLE